MTPCILFSDLHVDEYKAFSELHDRDRLGDCLAVIDDVYKAAKKRNAKIILFSGDFFNTPKFLFTKVINRTLDYLKKKIEANPDIVWYSITGQHDFATKNLLHKPTASAQEALASMFPDNFKLIDNTCYSSYNYIVFGIPNYEYKEHFRARLEWASQIALEYKAGKPYLKVTLMIHQSPTGQDNPNVRVQTTPEDPLYDIFDLVVCGDIHTGKRITDKFLIVGNPYQKDLGDEGKEKGIYYLDLEDPANTLKFISRKGRYPEFKRVKKGQPVLADTDTLVIQQPEPPTFTDEESTANVEEFGASLPHEQLMINFYNKLNGNDKKLLETGLSFLQK